MNKDLTCLQCDRHVVARMLCRNHYNNQYNKERRGTAAREDARPCLLEGCTKFSRIKNGLCARHNARRARWGLDATRFLKLANQRACDVCDAPPGERGLAFDHDHNHCEPGCAKCIRGVLCINCNVALGYAQDSIARLRKLADYLENVKTS